MRSRSKQIVFFLKINYPFFCLLCYFMSILLFYSFPFSFIKWNVGWVYSIFVGCRNYKKESKLSKKFKTFNDFCWNVLLFYIYFLIYIYEKLWVVTFNVDNSAFHEFWGSLSRNNVLRLIKTKSPNFIKKHPVFVYVHIKIPKIIDFCLFGQGPGYSKKWLRVRQPSLKWIIKIIVLKNE